MNKLSKKEQQQKTKFLESLENAIKTNKLKTTNKFQKDSVLICTATRDADYKDINRFWDLEENKSYPRDLYCYKCRRQVMISNTAFKAYNKAKQKPKILCGKCAGIFIKCE